jgi:hypothetical protein
MAAASGRGAGSRRRRRYPDYPPSFGCGRQFLRRPGSVTATGPTGSPRRRRAGSTRPRCDPATSAPAHAPGLAPPSVPHGIDWLTRHRYDRGGRSDGAIVCLFLRLATCECFLISRTRGRVAGKRRQTLNLAAVTIFKENRRCNPEVMVYRLYSLSIAGGTLLAPAPNPNSQGRTGEVAANLPTLLPPAPGAAFFMCQARCGCWRSQASGGQHGETRRRPCPARRGGSQSTKPGRLTRRKSATPLQAKALCVRNRTARSDFCWQVSTGR